MPSIGDIELHKLISDLQRRKQELVAQLEVHQESVRRSIFATIRAGLASQLLCLLQSTLYRVDERDYNGCTPLHVAAHEGRLDMVRILLSQGADPVAVDNIGRTPRDLAVTNRHANVVSYLEQMKPADSSVCLSDSDTGINAHHTRAESGGMGTSDDPLGLISSGMDDVDGDIGPDDSSSARFSQYSTISDNVSLVVCMVGLPGRGKSFISKRIARYLNWKGVPCRVFNAGNYRRQLLGANETAGAEFYDPSNQAAKELRELMAQMACDDLVKFLGCNPVGVGILDATNTTVERRKHLIHYFSEQQRTTLKKPVRVLFIESVCNDERIITENILRAKCGNDDFKHVPDASVVMSQFRDRIKQYEKVYESVQESEHLSFIKIVNIKENIVLSRISGGLPSRIVFFLLNLHPVAFPIFVATNCETEGNRDNVFGGSCHLTDKGRRMSRELCEFVRQRCDELNGGKFLVLHGTNPHVMASVAPLQELADAGCIQLIGTRSLDDINFGRMNGDSLAESIQNHPKRSKILFITHDDVLSVSPPHQGRFSATPLTRVAGAGVSNGVTCPSLRHTPSDVLPVLNYCVQFPSGESCRQVNVRLESVLMSLLRCGCPALVVAPDIPAQGVIAFFADMKPELSPYISVPRHHVVEITKGDVQLHELSTEQEM